MLRQQVSPRTAAFATLIILALVQLVYWRLLVYQKPGETGSGGGGGPLAPATAFAQGRGDVWVELVSGSNPGFQDGPLWQAQFNGPNALATHPDGSLLICDSRNHRIRRLLANGRVTTLAGGAEPGGEGARSEGPATTAGLRFPSGVAVDPQGTIYIADTGNHRICTLTGDRLATLAGGAEGRTDGAAGAARFRYPATLAWEAGALWIADLGNRAIRRLDAGGQVSTPAPVPPRVAALLGDVSGKSVGGSIQASPEGRGEAEAVALPLGRHSAGVWVGERLWIFADPEFHTLMSQRAQEPPLLLAGRRTGEAAVGGSINGEGHRASFYGPCAVAWAPDGTLYVAEYEGNRIRRLRLPGWIRSEEAPPAERRGRWRRNRGG